MACGSVVLFLAHLGPRKPHTFSHLWDVVAALDLLLWPLVPALGKAWTVAVIGAALALLTMVGQRLLADHGRLQVAKARATAAQASSRITHRLSLIARSFGTQARNLPLQRGRSLAETPRPPRRRLHGIVHVRLAGRGTTKGSREDEEDGTADERR